MFDEARDEHRIAGAVAPRDVSVIRDPNSYVYFEAKLTLADAAATAYVQDESGGWHASDEGLRELAVARNGWVPVAAPGGPSVRGVGWGCASTIDASGSNGSTIPASCHIQATRVFALNDRFVSGPNLIEPTIIDLHAGEMKPLPIATSPLLQDRRVAVPKTIRPAGSL